MEGNRDAAQLVLGRYLDDVGAAGAVLRHALEHEVDDAFDFGWRGIGGGDQERGRGSGDDGTLLPGVRVDGQRQSKQAGTRLSQLLEGGVRDRQQPQARLGGKRLERPFRCRRGGEQRIDLTAAQAVNCRASPRSPGFNPYAASTARASNRVPEVGVPMFTRRPRRSATSLMGESGRTTM